MIVPEPGKASSTISFRLFPADFPQSSERRGEIGSRRARVRGRSHRRRQVHSQRRARANGICRRPLLIKGSYASTLAINRFITRGRQLGRLSGA